MKRNKKGFTLVELLAVIVVLAIIMIIAIPQVMDSMASAKKNSLLVEARKVLNKTMEKVQVNSMESKATTGCFKITTNGTADTDINVDTGNKYKGSVNVAADGTYKIYITDGEYEIYDVTNSSLGNSSAAAYDSTHTDTMFAKCGSAS